MSYGRAPGWRVGVQ